MIWVRHVNQVPFQDLTCLWTRQSPYRVDTWILIPSKTSSGEHVMPIYCNKLGCLHQRHNIGDTCCRIHRILCRNLCKKRTWRTNQPVAHAARNLLQRLLITRYTQDSTPNRFESFFDSTTRTVSSLQIAHVSFQGKVPFPPSLQYLSMLSTAWRQSVFFQLSTWDFLRVWWIHRAPRKWIAQ